MTYRLDSDIPTPYRKSIKLEKKPEQSNINYALNKTKMVYWLVSHCAGVYRNKVVDLLEKFGVHVDVGGDCSGKFPHRLKCGGKSHGRIAMVNNLDHWRNCEGLPKYRFYAALENSHCHDYITEKYYDTIFLSPFNVIPIVLGGANYSDPNIAIPDSFINVQDFSSVKELAGYLLKVASNDTLFNSYFESGEENINLLSRMVGLMSTKRDGLVNCVEKFKKEDIFLKFTTTYQEKLALNMTAK